MDTPYLANSTFSEINELIGHLIWPFFLIVFFFLFRDKISDLIKSLKKLKISEFEAEFNEREKAFAEEEVSPINDEIDGLISRVKDLEEQNNIKQISQETDAKVLDETSIKTRIIEALENSSYKWRSIPKLASIAGVPEEKVLETIRKDMNIVLSKGKSGRQIARMKNK